MPNNSHYYDRNSGKIVRRSDADSEGREGNKVGHKHRKRDKTRGVYPAPGLPIRRSDKTQNWIDGYIRSYYQPHLGGVDLSHLNPVVEIDRSTLERLDLLAEQYGLYRAEMLEILIDSHPCPSPLTFPPSSNV